MRPSSIATICGLAGLALTPALSACNKKQEAASQEAAPSAPVAPAPAVKRPVETRPLPPLAEDPGGATGKPQWATSLGGLGIDVPRDLALGANGEVYVAGYFDGEATFGAAGKHAAAMGDTPGVPSPKPGTKPKPAADAYLVKLESDGKVAWARTFGANRDDAANGVATRGDTVVVAGNFLDELRIGELVNKAAGSDDLFVAAFDTGGEPRWVWTAGGIDSDGANTVAAAPDGGWIVGGSFSDAVTFGATTLKAQGGTDALLVKLAASGELEWVKQFGGRHNDKIVDVAVDPHGNLYVQGTFRDEATWGGEPLQASGAAPDLVLAKYDLNGDHVWSKRFGNAFEEAAGGVTVDPAGNITMAGSFDRSLAFGEGDAHTSLGEADAFIARFSNDGTLAWVRTYGAERVDTAVGIASDAAGNTVTSGFFEGTVDFGAGAVASKGNKDVFAVKLDPKGGLVWAQTWGDRDHDQGRVVAIDPQGHVVIAGLYRFAFTAASPVLQSVRADGDRIPKPDTFVVKLAR